MRRNPDIYKTEAIFRAFMRALNLRGSGVLFESMSDQEVNHVLLKCRDDALERTKKSSKPA